MRALAFLLMTAAVAASCAPIAAAPGDVAAAAALEVENGTEDPVEVGILHEADGTAWVFAVLAPGQRELVVVPRGFAIDGVIRLTVRPPWLPRPVLLPRPVELVPGGIVHQRIFREGARAQRGAT